MIDLHTHSTMSDGSDSPARVVELAAEAGCKAIALTDHDRLDGIPGARARAEELGLELVPGCEVSCEIAVGTLHALVYFLEPGCGAFEHELFVLQGQRDERNVQLVEHLSSLGLPVSLDELTAEGGRGAGRPHAAAILMRKGVVGSIREAFDVWLARGRPGYIERPRLAPQRVAQLALASRGVAVVAHPLSLALSPASMHSTVGELAALGFSGIEAWYGDYEPSDREGLAALAARHGLVATGGSDYHGTYKPHLQVGVGRGDLDVDDGALDELRQRIPA